MNDIDKPISDRWVTIAAQGSNQILHVRLDEIACINLSSDPVKYGDEIVFRVSGTWRVNRDVTVELLEKLRAYENTRIEERITLQALAEL